jgi:hypothetical protein
MDYDFVLDYLTKSFIKELWRRDMKNQPFYQTTAKFIAALMIVMLVLAALPVAPAFAAARTASVSGDWNDTATWGGAAVPTLADDCTIGDGVTVTVTAAAVCNSLTLSPALAATGVTISGTNTLTITNGVNLQAPAAAINSTLAVNAGLLDVGTSITITGGAIAGYNSILSVSNGTINVTNITFGANQPQQQLTFTGAGTLNIGGTGTLGAGGTFTPSTGKVNYNGTAQAVGAYTYNNLTLSGSGLKTIGAVTVNGILSMEGTATASAAPTYDAAATLKYNTATARTNGPEWAVTPFPGTGGVIIANTGAITLNGDKVLGLAAPLTINSGATLITANWQLAFGGNFVNAGTFTAGSSSIVILDTMVTQSIAGFTTTGDVAMYKASGMATFQGNVNGAKLTINGTGILNLGTGLTHTFTSDWRRLVGTVNGGSSTLKIGGDVDTDAGLFVPSTSTVEWNKAGTQTISFGPYYNLTLSGSGIKRLSNDTAILGDLTIGTGTTLDVTATPWYITLYGNWVNNGTFTQQTNGRVYLQGPPIQQNVGGSTVTTFYDLYLNNSAGAILSNDITIDNLLTLTNGKLTTGANTLTLTLLAGVTGASPNRYVVGNMRKAFDPANWNYQFDIGDASRYAPVVLGITNPFGWVTASVTNAACGAPGINQSKNVNHCWTLAGPPLITFTSYSAVFVFPNGGAEVDPLADWNNFIVGKLDSATWSYIISDVPGPAPYIARGSTSIQVNNLTSMSSFEVGEPIPSGPVDKLVKGSDTNKAVAAFTLTAAAPVAVGSVVVTGSGSLADVATNGVKLWQDNGIIGEYDGADVAIGTGVSFSGSTATFSSPAITATTTPTKYLITYDIIASPTDGDTLAATLVSVTPGSISTTGLRYATLTVDSLGPTIVISAPSVTTTLVGPVTYTVTYADPHFNTSTLVAGNITLNTTGTANGTKAVTGTGLTRTVTISSITGTGTLGISIAAGTASDLLGNLSLAAGPSATFTVGTPTTTAITNAATLASTPSQVGQAYTVNFTVTATSGNPTGSVTVSDGTVTCTGTLAAGAGTTSTGTCNLTSTTAGVKTLTATYTGVAPFAGSSGTATHTVSSLSITSLNPTTTTAGGAGFALTVNGTGFVSGSTVRWNGANRVTTFGSSTQLTAAILGTDISTTGVAIVDVINAAPAATSNGKPFFITMTSTTVTGSALSTGANPTATFGNVTANATGTGTLVVAQYATNPAGVPTFAAKGLYYDVHITPPGSFTQVSILFCGLTSSDSIFFWNGSAWVTASNQTFAAGCWTVTVNASTVPTLTNLGGAVFGVGSGAPIVVSSLPADPNPTAAVSVHFTVTFSTAVTGVDTTDFALTATGITGASVTSVSGGPTAYTVTVNTGAGSGTLRLDVIDNDTIIDGSGNHLGGTGAGNGNYTSGTTYSVRPVIFTDVPITHWAFTWIERLYFAGVTDGCITTIPRSYCPENNVTRAEMAKFLLKGKHGSSYVPPAVGTSTGFTDVPTTYWAAAWIKELAAEGITSGCTATTFCPDQQVTRAQMAKFLLSAKHGLGYTPPAVGTSTGFADVATTHWAAAWIKQLAAEGITTIPAGGNYLPESPVTRAEMAKFLVAAFNLP